MKLVAVPPAAHQSNVPQNILTLIENKISGLAATVADEDVLSALSLILHDLAFLRVSMDRPLHQDKRAAPRFHDNAVLLIDRESGEQVIAAIQDVSTGGALLETDAAFADREVFSVSFPGMQAPVSAVVLSTEGCNIRVAFSALSADEAVALAKHIDRHVARA